MLFTRTIRRKLLLGLLLVLSMLLTASLSGVWGLSSYANLIGEVEVHLQQTPHREDLIVATASLIRPLSHKPDPQVSTDKQNDFRRAQLVEYSKLLAKTRGAYRTFQLNWESQPLNPVTESQYPLLNNSLFYFEVKLARLESLAQDALRQPQVDESRVQQLLAETGQLSGIAINMLDPATGLNNPLQRARKNYESTSAWLWAATTVAVILFLGLIRYGYVHVFQPIRSLYEGARRVAQGDFNYRIQIATHDEMGELAESFNQMTARFQDIAGDLDRQVNERSRQLVRSERLAAVGFLSAGVAHEINNPLSAIAMASESVEDRIAGILEGHSGNDEQVVREYLQMIQRESFRCREITTKLLDFSRGGESARERTDVASLVSEVISMVGHLSKYRDMKIDFRYSNPSYLEANAAELKQVILNLVANALESMESEGVLTIEIQEKTDEVRMVFCDEGCGMTPEVIDNLFEPFFTNRRVGKGTGLGLSISHRIISDHGGTIEAYSEGVGRGSTFSVSLPRRSVVAAA